jgi:hypothetical protein
MTGSSTTLVPEALAAADEFVNLMLGDQTMDRWFSMGSKFLDPGRLERNIKRLLRVYASELRQDASGLFEKEAVQLIWSRAGYIAYCVCYHYDKSPATEPSRFEQLRNRKPDKRALLQDYLSGAGRKGVVSSQPRADDDEVASDSGPSSEADDSDFRLGDLDQVKLFMVESAAYERFRENLEHFILQGRGSKGESPSSIEVALMPSSRLWFFAPMNRLDYISKARKVAKSGLSIGYNGLRFVQHVMLEVLGRDIMLPPWRKQVRTAAIKPGFHRPGRTKFTWTCGSVSSLWV